MANSIDKQKAKEFWENVTPKSLNLDVIGKHDVLHLIKKVETLEDIETDLNNTIGFMEQGISQWKCNCAELENRLKTSIDENMQRECLEIDATATIHECKQRITELEEEIAQRDIRFKELHEAWENMKEYSSRQGSAIRLLEIKIAEIEAELANYKHDECYEVRDCDGKLVMANYCEVKGCREPAELITEDNREFCKGHITNQSAKIIAALEAKLEESEYVIGRFSEWYYNDGCCYTEHGFCPNLAERKAEHDGNMALEKEEEDRWDFDAYACGDCPYAFESAGCFAEYYREQFKAKESEGK